MVSPMPILKPLWKSQKLTTIWIGEKLLSCFGTLFAKYDMYQTSLRCSHSLLLLNDPEYELAVLDQNAIVKDRIPRLWIRRLIGRMTRESVCPSTKALALAGVRIEPSHSDGLTLCGILRGLQMKRRHIRIYKRHNTQVYALEYGISLTR